MNINKTIAAAAIGGSILLGLSACASSDASGPAPAPSTPAAASSPAAVPSEVATPEPTNETPDAPTVTVKPGGLFAVNAPKGMAKFADLSTDELKFTMTYDEALIAPAEAADAPKTKEDFASIVAADVPATDGTSLWKAKDGASGQTELVVSYTNPKTGAVVSTNLVVVVK